MAGNESRAVALRGSAYGLAPQGDGSRSERADAQPRQQFLGRAADEVSDRARAGREDHGEADKEGGGGDGGGGFVGRVSQRVRAKRGPMTGSA